ncbi:MULTISPECIES: hypothetical protein [Clostridium]|uniref:hypothetical protein n=1 Tax=Clostridium TaxID=1485 RepID=UPI00189E3EE5|nr:hypothetical protein [Clostridium paraputrificum]
MSKVNESQEVKRNILETFIPPHSKGVRKKSAGGGISVVNAKTGKRVAVSKSILDYVGVVDKIQFAFSDNEIAVGKDLPNNDNYFTIKISKSKGNVYSTGLVSEITELYDLDFKDKTSITFDDIQYQNIQGVNIAIIKIK